MSTYKQRTSYHRPQHQLARSPSDLQETHQQPSQDSQQHNTTTGATSNLTTISAGFSPSSPLPQRESQPSFATANAIPHHLLASTTSALSGGSSYHTADENPYPEETPSFALAAADLEWTSIRNSASVARAKQRQQQYRERQQERTREWQFLLSQHHRPSSQQPPKQPPLGWMETSPSRIASTPGVGTQRQPPHSNTNTSSMNSSNNSARQRGLFAEEMHDEIIPEFDPMALEIGSERRTAARMVNTQNTEEHLSSGSSDLIATSDGLESIGGESEDLGGWSQADVERRQHGNMDDNDEEEALSFTLSTSSPILQRHPSSFSNRSSPRMVRSTGSTSASVATPVSTDGIRPKVSGRSDSVSSIASFGRLPRPSFADSSSTRPYSRQLKQQQARTPPSPVDHMRNQMPHHDGSGNFVDLLDEQRSSPSGYQFSGQTVDLLSDMEDSQDLDRDWESSSQESSVLRAYQQAPILRSSLALRRRISSSEFQMVIQNIADLQHQNYALDQGPNSIYHHHHHHHHHVLSSPLSLSRFQLQPSPPALPQELQPRFTYLYSGSKRPIFNIYEDEMENMADMMYEFPSQGGWMQTFATVLTAMQPSKSTPYFQNHDKWHPIKVIKILASENDEASETANDTKQEIPDQDDTIMDEEKKETLRKIRGNMNSANMATLQRLQQNGRRRATNTPDYRRPTQQRGASFDPMLVEFSPTLRVQDQSLSASSTHDGMTSRSTGATATQSVLDSNLWAVVLSTLRRFRDNFLLTPSDVYEEDDLETQWPLPSSPSRGRRLTRENLAHFRSGQSRARSAGTTTSSVSSFLTTNRGRGAYSGGGGGAATFGGVPRVNSDCGMESLRDHLNHPSSHSYEPQLVE